MFIVFLGIVWDSFWWIFENFDECYFKYLYLEYKLKIFFIKLFFLFFKIIYWKKICINLFWFSILWMSFDREYCVYLLLKKIRYLELLLYILLYNVFIFYVLFCVKKGILIVILNKNLSFVFWKFFYFLIECWF